MFLNRADKTMEKEIGPIIMQNHLIILSKVKLAVDWKPQCTKELIEKIRSDTELDTEGTRG